MGEAKRRGTYEERVAKAMAEQKPKEKQQPKKAKRPRRRLIAVEEGIL